MNDDVDDIDWLKWMRVKDSSGYDIFTERHLDDDWVIDKCKTAVDECFTLIPEAEVRYREGKLSERVLAEVVCQMVLRVARWTGYKSETDGSYTYTRADDSQLQPAWAASPNLKPTKHEIALLKGYSDDEQPIGTLRMGLDRVYGL